ncbi:hypothetical protein NP511_22270 (plasmid) [Natrinema thermotolerans]|uniref:DUF8030 domain-containing protein n=1 Tax=Natrinema thermotolerans TaxID=121872 RepID=A0AAF0T3S2_9EURY|nr:hypothetical protein [Natrinema thermotolerans]QCC57161.1 hypothetical protein DVR14_00365 [Natrinema thermotolerans]WMT10323.1 hypothetical protein NP511_22270 [Natrinema thermotolerans]
MTTERQHPRDRGIDRTPTHRQPSKQPWSDLELRVPNDRSRESLVSFVECVLVELTHADVGAEYRSSNVWGVKLTQYIAADTVGERFEKLHYDERLGWHKQMMSRQDVRDELINRLARPASLATNQSHPHSVEEPDTFRVKPTWQLRMDRRPGEK